MTQKPTPAGPGCCPYVRWSALEQRLAIHAGDGWRWLKIVRRGRAMDDVEGIEMAPTSCLDTSWIVDE